MLGDILELLDGLFERVKVIRPLGLSVQLLLIYYVVTFCCDINIVVLLGFGIKIFVFRFYSL